MELYSVKQAADFLGLSTRTIYRYVREGRIKGVRVGRSWRISTDELERIAEQGTETAATEAEKRKE